MSNFTDLIAEEQVLTAVMKSANAELEEAIIRKERMMPGSTAFDEMVEDIKSYRENVITVLRNKMSNLDSRKKESFGITDFNWRH